MVALRVPYLFHVKRLRNDIKHIEKGDSSMGWDANGIQWKNPHVTSSCQQSNQLRRWIWRKWCPRPPRCTLCPFDDICPQPEKWIWLIWYHCSYLTTSEKGLHRNTVKVLPPNEINLKSFIFLTSFNAQKKSRCQPNVIVKFNVQWPTIVILKDVEHYFQEPNERCNHNKRLHAQICLN